MRPPLPCRIDRHGTSWPTMAAVRSFSMVRMKLEAPIILELNGIGSLEMLYKCYINVYYLIYLLFGSWLIRHVPVIWMDYYYETVSSIEKEHGITYATLSKNPNPSHKASDCYWLHSIQIVYGNVGQARIAGIIITLDAKWGFKFKNTHNHMLESLERPNTSDSDHMHVRICHHVHPSLNPTSGKQRSPWKQKHTQLHIVGGWVNHGLPKLLVNWPNSPMRKFTCKHTLVYTSTYKLVRKH